MLQAMPAAKNKMADAVAQQDDDGKLHPTAADIKVVRDLLEPEFQQEGDDTVIRFIRATNGDLPHVSGESNRGKTGFFESIAAARGPAAIVHCTSWAMLWRKRGQQSTVAWAVHTQQGCLHMRHLHRCADPTGSTPTAASTMPVQQQGPGA